jgi:hypothetical protein
MTGQHEFDRVLEDWLTRGPSQLPERAIHETVRQLDDIKQQGRLRLLGNERMQRLILSATGIAAALVFALLAYSSLNGGLQFGAPSGIPFTSERHGYTIVLPDESWTVEERSGSWALGEFFDANSEAGVDYYEHLGPDGQPVLYVYLSSQAVPAGMSFDEWVATHDASTDREQPCFKLVGEREERVVDGEPARISTYTCDDFSGGLPWTGVQTMVAHAGRGYAIYVWPAPLPGFGTPSDMTTSELQDEAAKWLARFSITD